MPLSKLVILGPLVLAILTLRASTKTKSYIAILGPTAALAMLLLLLILSPENNLLYADFGVFWSITICIVWTAVSIFCLGYFSTSDKNGRFHTASLITLSGALGTALTQNLLIMVFCFELMCFSAYFLIIHRNTNAALRAGSRYLVTSILGAIGLLLGVMFTFKSGQTLWFSDMPLANLAGGSISFVCYVFGFGMMAALFPFHTWLVVNNFAAPAPASALTTAVITETGLFCLLRVIYQLYGIDFIRTTGWNVPLVYISVLTILLGSTMAIPQQHIKRRLAFSAIGQVGVILAGISLLDEKALQGALFHMFAHALTIAALFMASGAMRKITGKTRVDDFSGIASRMPLTFAAFSISAFSMMGIPPLAGFVSKWDMAQGSLNAKAIWVLVTIIVASFLNGLHYMPIVISGYFHGSKNLKERTKEPKLLHLPVLALAVVILTVGLLNHPPLTMATTAARRLFLND